MNSSNIKNKYILIVVCFVFPGQNCSAKSQYPILRHVPAMIGAALACYSLPHALKAEEIIAQELVKKLQSNIEKRKKSVYARIESLQDRLNELHTQAQKDETMPSVEEKTITVQLEQAYQEYRTIDLDYQIEYIRTRPRARYLKDESRGCVVIGSFFTCMSIFFTTFE